MGCLSSQPATGNTLDYKNEPQSQGQPLPVAGGVAPNPNDLNNADPNGPQSNEPVREREQVSMSRMPAPVTVSQMSPYV